MSLLITFASSIDERERERKNQDGGPQNRKSGMVCFFLDLYLYLAHLLYCFIRLWIANEMPYPKVSQLWLVDYQVWPLGGVKVNSVF